MGVLPAFFRGTWPAHGHTAVAMHGAAARGSLRQQSPSWPHRQATKPRAGPRRALRSSSEVNIHFIVLALEMAKEKFSSATFSCFFFCSPKQPPPILCETRRGINMEINDTEIPSIPDATIIFSLLLHLGPVPGKSTRWGDGEESRTPVCPETGNLWTLIQTSNTVLHCGRY